MRNISDKSFRENRIYILYSITSSENLVIRDNVQKYGRTTQIIDDNKIWRMRLECRIRTEEESRAEYSSMQLVQQGNSCISTIPDLSCNPLLKHFPAIRFEESAVPCW